MKSNLKSKVRSAYTPGVKQLDTPGFNIIKSIMPKRKTPLVNKEIYHVFNRSVAQQPIFRNKREYDLFTNLIEYYRFPSPPVRFSHYSRLNIEDKTKFLNKLYRQNKYLVDIYSFCLMPNHYHLLLIQNTNDGIMNFVRLLQNSYARYLNIKTKRFGSLFQSPFKAKRIETGEQFIHIARYIHLNPLTSYKLNDFAELSSYPWSSYKDYQTNSDRKFIKINTLLGFFKNKEKLEKFTQDNLDYQRKLEKIKHLTID